MFSIPAAKNMLPTDLPILMRELPILSNYVHDYASLLEIAPVLAKDFQIWSPLPEIFVGRPF